MRPLKNQTWPIAMFIFKLHEESQYGNGIPGCSVSLTMTVRPMQVIDKVIRQRGMTAIFHEDERWANCYIKSLNLLSNILAKQIALEAGAYEAILVKDGFITEGN